MNYYQAREFLAQKTSSGATLGLSRVKLLASYLGEPYKDLSIIHVTGTNGKGSFCAFLQSILTQAGFLVGSFNSPFIQDYREQIRVNGQNISEEDLACAVSVVQEAADRMLQDGHSLPTEFELLFCASLVHFRRIKCNRVILEVGMGGAGDATNIIGTPLLSVFTPISMDHTAWLGDSIDKIALEKSGIIKENGCVLTAPQETSVYEILQTTSAARSCTFHESAKVYDKFGDINGQKFSLDFADASPLTDCRITMQGSYQPGNAALAASAARILGISDDVIREGLSLAAWPGRFEILQQDHCVIIDGAHNPDGIRALKNSIQTLFPGKKLIFIAGVLADKDHREMMAEMLPLAKCFHTVTVPNARAMNSAALAGELRSLSEELADSEGNPPLPVTAHNSIEEAVFCAQKEAGTEDVILAFGSLYYVGIVRGILLNPSSL